MRVSSGLTEKRKVGLAAAMAGVLLIGAGWLASPASSSAGQAGKEGPAPSRFPGPRQAVRPWDEAPVGPSPWAEALNGAFDLRLRGQAGQEHRYEIWRQNVNYDKIGRPVGKTISIATCRHALLRETRPGIWTQKIIWEKFAYGSSISASAEPVPKEIEAARGIAYDYFPPAFDIINPPGDFARIGEPLTAYALKVLCMDMAMFDSLPLKLTAGTKAGVRIGDSAENGGWTDALKIGEKKTREVTGTYQLGGAAVGIAGLTRCQGEPGILICYSSEGNAIKQEMGGGTAALRMEGTEYFRGSLTVSLVDGHVVAGELSGFVPMVIGAPGQAAAEIPVKGVLQQVGLREVRLY